MNGVDGGRVTALFEDGDVFVRRETCRVDLSFIEENPEEPVVSGDVFR